MNVGALAGVGFSNLPVATFTDQAGSDSKPGDLSATIDWGDGQPGSPDTSAGTLVKQGTTGAYVVEGSHQYAAAGSYTITVTIDDKGSQTATATAAATVGNTVWVNDNWVNVTNPSGPLTAGDTVAAPAGETAPNLGSGTLIYGVNAFSTIQSGVTNVDAYGTVYVLPGTYAGGIQINKPVTLLGANSSNNPTVAGSRGSESVIEPVVSAPSPYVSAAPGVLVEVLASNVTISGFTFTGQNNALGTGNGVALTETGSSPIYAQAVEAIASYVPVHGTDIENYGTLPSYTAPANLVIQNNIVEELQLPGHRPRLGQRRNAHRGQHDRPEPVPEHRRLQRPGSCGPPLQQLLCRRGPQHDAERAGGRSSEQLLAGAPTGGTTGSVEYNQISARRRGIFYNLIYGSSTTVPIEYNTITATADANWGSSLWTGVYIVSQQNSVTGTFLDNSISGAGSSYATTAGYTVLSTAATTSVTLSGDSSPLNSVSNVTYGVWETTGDPNGIGGAAASNMNVTVSGLNISAGQYGVYVEEDPELHVVHGCGNHRRRHVDHHRRRRNGRLCQRCESQRHDQRQQRLDLRQRDRHRRRRRLGHDQRQPHLRQHDRRQGRLGHRFHQRQQFRRSHRQHHRPAGCRRDPQFAYKQYLRRNHVHQQPNRPGHQRHDRHLRLGDALGYYARRPLRGREPDHRLPR